MEDEASKMKALFARAKATREGAASSVPPRADASLTVPLCTHCGAPREVLAGQAAEGTLARACRYCNIRNT